MTTTPFFHGTFTLTRRWNAAPDRVFAAWADPAVKAQWFGPREDWSLIRRSLDVRAGGTEVLEGTFTKTGRTALFEARYHLVEPDRRLIYDYDLHHGGSFHSVTLSSLVLQPENGGTRVSYTEQIVFIDGTDGTAGREHGTSLQFDLIEKVLMA